MTVAEFYEKIGGNYQEALSRLMSDDFAKKILSGFPKDESYAKLCEAVEAGDVEAAFMQAHTLKGLCANLALGNLTEIASEVTELFRDGDMAAGAAKMPELESCYNDTLSSLTELIG